MPHDFNQNFLTIRLAAQMKDAGVPDLPDAVNAARWVTDAPPPPDPILRDLFDTGDKVPIIGSSKTRKTFYALQLAISLAAGRKEFLRWTVHKKRRVLFVQMEVKEAHFWKRVHNMARALGITAADLDDNLAILNLRGKTIQPQALIPAARAHRADVVIADPIYKLLTGDENLAMDVKPLFAAFDALTEDTKAACIYVHHNAKGVAGDRDTRDRGAGSGVIARDFDAAMYLTEHRDGEDRIVIETLLRNYAPQEAFTIRWQDGLFVADGTAPIVRTSRNKDTGGKPPISDEEAIAKASHDGAQPARVFRSRLRGMGMTEDHAREVMATIKPFIETGIGASHWYGTPDKIEAARRRYQNPSFEDAK